MVLFCKWMMPWTFMLPCRHWACLSVMPWNPCGMHLPLVKWQTNPLHLKGQDNDCFVSKASWSFGCCGALNSLLEDGGQRQYCFLFHWNGVLQLLSTVLLSQKKLYWNHPWRMHMCAGHCLESIRDFICQE